MTTMLEKAAMAAAFAGADTLGLGTPEDLWEWMSDDQRDAMLAMVRAAFVVVREPDLNVCWTAAKAYEGAARDSGKIQRTFAEIIDAILEGKA